LSFELHHCTSPPPRCTNKHVNTNMSFARGERVHFDFDTGAISGAGPDENDVPPSLSTAFVGDILEHAPSTTNPPSAPTFTAKSNNGGFPAHKKRVSAFKERRTANPQPKTQTGATNPPNGTFHPPTSTRTSNFEDEERRRIDEENTQRIASMSAEEIEEERRELMSALPPSLIEKLLGRANLADGSNERDFGVEKDEEAPATTAPETTIDGDKVQERKESGKKVTFNISTSEGPPLPPSTAVATISSSTPGLPEDLEQSGSIHFPVPSQPPDLDPNSNTFLTDLHEKYFPNLPYDPSSLSWMSPIDPTDTSSAYHPSQTALNASELRFDFTGALLAPSRAREIEVTKGLHHHSDAPEAAGYTIPELARLSRSAVAAQRCMSYQTLGRILYRLGKGEYGDEHPKNKAERPPVQVVKDPNQVGGDEESDGEEEDVGSAMARGLWMCIEEGRVVETLTEEAGKEKGHLTAKTYAQEALWNWRRGGGRKRGAV
jgi:hypothetical protein